MHLIVCGHVLVVLKTDTAAFNNNKRKESSAKFAAA